MERDGHDAASPLFLYPKLCVRCGQLAEGPAGPDALVIAHAGHRGCAALHLACAIQNPEAVARLAPAAIVTPAQHAGIEALLQHVGGGGGARASGQAPTAWAAAAAAHASGQAPTAWAAAAAAAPARAPAAAPRAFPGYTQCRRAGQTLSTMLAHYAGLTLRDLTATGFTIDDLLAAHRDLGVAPLVALGTTVDALTEWLRAAAPQHLDAATRRIDARRWPLRWSEWAALGARAPADVGLRAAHEIAL